MRRYLRSMRSMFRIVPAVVLGLAPSLVANAADKMYWIQFAVDSASLYRADLDGTDKQFLAGESIGGPTAVAVDAQGGKLYYGLATDNVPGLYRSDLDGSDPQNLLLDLPSSLALDFSGGRLYWISYYDPDVIRSANQNGSDQQTLLTGLSSPRGLSVDAVGGKMYWTESGPPRLRRANLDGSGAEDLATAAIPFSHTALALGLGKVYWLAQPSATTNELRRANLDGSNAEPLPAALNVVGGLDYHEAVRALFLTEADDFDVPGRILRLSPDGTGPIEVTNIDGPGDIDLDDPLTGGGNGVPALSWSGGLALVLVLLATSSAWLLGRRRASTRP